jgi:hypothetical protein
MASTATGLRSSNMSVHAVSEYIFCPLAGLNAYLECREDFGCEPSILRLDYQPPYEVSKLRQRLEALARAIWQLSGASAILLIIGALLAVFVHWIFFVAAVAASIFIGRTFIKLLPEVWKLLAALRAARGAKAQEPNPDFPHDELVDWWSLRAAGFESTPCTELLVDAELRLQGRPWRILSKGDLAIPAYVRTPRDEILPQQRARIAAYCHLIQKNQGANAPYGIILDQGTFTGTAIKPNQDDNRRWQQALRSLPSAAEDYLVHRRNPARPDPPHICRGCEHGRPRLLQLGKSTTKTMGSDVAPYQRRSPTNNRVYHSSCGDRFGWIPPHEKAESLQL